MLDEVSIALDKVDGVMHKHGSTEMVTGWANGQRSALRAAGLDELADNIVVLTGRFPLGELNTCLSTTGYAGRLYRQPLAGELAQLPLVGCSATPLNTPASGR